jgi:hypothetical protein
MVNPSYLYSLSICIDDILRMFKADVNCHIDVIFIYLKIFHLNLIYLRITLVKNRRTRNETRGSTSEAHLYYIYIYTKAIMIFLSNER